MGPLAKGSRTVAWPCRNSCHRSHQEQKEAKITVRPDRSHQSAVLCTGLYNNINTVDRNWPLVLVRRSCSMDTVRKKPSIYITVVEQHVRTNPVSYCTQFRIAIAIIWCVQPCRQCIDIPMNGTWYHIPITTSWEWELWRSEAVYFIRCLPVLYISYHTT
jgi:hypothetical protein